MQASPGVAGAPIRVRMNVQTSRALTLLSDSTEAHMAIWRLRAALPACAVTVTGRDVVISSPGERESYEVDRALLRIPNARTYLSW